MSVAIIADSHLGGPGGTADLLVEQLADLPGEGCRRLILLGDIFHYWLADPRFETPEIRAVVSALADLRGAGVEVDYVEGNRDFFLAGSPYARLFDRIGTELAFEVGGRRYLAVHGDGLDDDDRQYRFWRWLSKSWLSRQLISNLPGALVRRLTASAEAGLGRTNFKHKSRIPVEVIRRYGARRLAEGHDVLLLGHFHEPHVWTVPGGEVRLLDAWFRSRRVVWLRETPVPVAPGPNAEHVK